MAHASVRLVLITSLGFAFGCDRDTTRDNSEGKGLNGDVDPCAGLMIEPIDWEAESRLGISARDAFAELEGSCTTAMTWDASGADLHTIEPTTAETEITVEVMLDEDSARQAQPTDDALEQGCEPALEVDAMVHAQTADGTLDDQGEATLTYTERGGVGSFGFSTKYGEHGGSLSIELADNESASLSYQVYAVGGSCQGRVLLGIGSSSGGGKGSASSGIVGMWSDDGCEPGKTLVVLDEGRGDLDAVPSELVKQAFGELSLDGSWDEGGDTQLQIETELTATDVCMDEDVLEIPLSITYGSSDGAIDRHTTDANARLAVLAEGSVTELTLWLSETLECDDEDDMLAYTLEDCSVLESVEIQLGLEYVNGQVRSGEGLNVYESRRDGDADPGAADVVRTLSLQ